MAAAVVGVRVVEEVALLEFLGLLVRQIGEVVQPDDRDAHDVVPDIPCA